MSEWGKTAPIPGAEIGGPMNVEQSFQLRERVRFYRQQIADAREAMRVYPRLLREAEDELAGLEES